VDGFCCDSDCSGPCEACHIIGSEGTCSPIQGSPADGHPDCVGFGDCQGSCNGLDGNSCVYPDVDIVCEGANCSGLIAEAERRCDGHGACVGGSHTLCAYGCSNDICATAPPQDAGTDATDASTPDAGEDAEVALDADVPSDAETFVDADAVADASVAPDTDVEPEAAAVETDAEEWDGMSSADVEASDVDEGTAGASPAPTLHPGGGCTCDLTQRRTSGRAWSMIIFVAVVLGIRQRRRGGSTLRSC